MTSVRRLDHRAAFAAGAALLIAALLGGCGSDKPDAATRQAAISLQAAMGAASRGIDNVRPTRASLDNLSGTLRDAGDQTGDVIAVLTTKTDAKAASLLLVAARRQRQFLQDAASAAADHSRTAALASVAKARAVGVSASNAYADATGQVSALAGLVPAATTFATGRLRDAITSGVGTSSTGGGTTPTTPTPSTATPAPGGTAPSGMTDCGAGIYANASTTCSFARNVAQAYAESGGGDVIDVYSPVTKQTYTMRCSGAMPTVCTGGNGARVEIR